MHLIILRNHPTKRYPGLFVDMIKDTFQRLTTDIVEVNIYAIWTVPAFSFFRKKISIAKRKPA